MTPRQQERLQAARDANEKRVLLEFTDAQKAEWQAAVDEELAGKDENIAHHRKIQTASQQTGFFGDVRRAITHSHRPIADLASEIGIDARQLSDFRAGDAELAPEALDRLIQTLGLRLMQEIPRS